MLLRRLPALAVVLCLLASQAWAGVGTSRCACCAARPCCAGKTHSPEAERPGTEKMGMPMGAACSMHRSDPAGCRIGPAGEGLALVHVHPELAPRPAVFSQAGALHLPSLATRLPERGSSLPFAPSAPPELRPPRFLAVV